jgi:hypothetical protein
MNVNEAKQVMLRTHLAAIKAGYRATGIHLESGPGIGKSDGVFQYTGDLARAVNQPVGLVTFMLATIESVDVRGFMIPTKADEGASSPGTVFSIPPWYPTRRTVTVITPDGKVYRPGEWSSDIPEIGVEFLDEFSQADDSVKKPAAELIYKGEVGTCRLPPLWRVVSAGNRMSDRSGVARELMFIVNRRSKLTIEPSLPAWRSHVTSLPDEQQPHYLTLSFAEKHPEVVFKDSVPASTDQFCTPRSLLFADRDLRALRSDEDVARNRLPVDPLARETAAGAIGQGAAAQFFSHLKYADELPDIADIIKAPDKAKVPANNDAQMVAGYMLAANITEKSAAPIVDYMRRLKIEMQVLTVRAMTANDKKRSIVITVPALTRWLSDNKDLLLAAMA